MAELYKGFEIELKDIQVNEHTLRGSYRVTPQDGAIADKLAKKYLKGFFANVMVEIRTPTGVDMKTWPAEELTARAKSDIDAVLAVL